ncbi:MAG: F-box protein [Chlamydiota bacterium]
MSSLTAVGSKKDNHLTIHNETKSKFNIEVLSNDTLRLVFSFISLKEAQSVMIMCRNWHRIIEDKSFIRHGFNIYFNYWKKAINDEVSIIDRIARSRDFTKSFFEASAEREKNSVLIYQNTY